jgi:hypothetical protein
MCPSFFPMARDAKFVAAPSFPRAGPMCVQHLMGAQGSAAPAVKMASCSVPEPYLRSRPGQQAASGSPWQSANAAQSENWLVEISPALTASGAA